MSKSLFRKDHEKKKRYIKVNNTKVTTDGYDTNIYIKCDNCFNIIYKDDYESNLRVCPKCDFHFRIDSDYRLKILADKNSFYELDGDMKSKNPLDFPGYDKKVEDLVQKTGLNEAVVTGECKIDGFPTVIAVMDSRFLMGSMGSVVGEKITRVVEYATKNSLPVIIFSASGGARMQEGVVSLMQMGKTSAALKRHSDKGLLFISVLTHPTTGGVTASFAMLGDIIIAEPGALIGFAGPRVIKQTINQDLPEGFQKSEFLKEHGFVDKIVKRDEMKKVLSDLLDIHKERV